MTAQDRVVGPDGHVDVDVLSDLVEGLLTEAEAAGVEAHIATCADCRDTRDALAEVRVLLAEQPAEPMPDDVFARIESALAGAAADVPTPRPESAPGLGVLPPPRPHRTPGASGEPGASAEVVHLDAVRRRRRLGPVLLGAAAAVAAVVFGVVIAAGGLDGGSESHDAGSAPEAASGVAAPTGKANSSPGSGAGAPPQAAPSSASPGTALSLPVYTSGTVGQLVGALLDRQSVAASASSGGTVGGSPSAGDSGAETGTGKAAAPPVPSCVASVAAKDAGGRQPTTSERALYQGEVAYVLVYVEPNGRDADVVIVSAACAERTTSQDFSDGTSSQSSRVLLSTSVPVS